MKKIALLCIITCALNLIAQRNVMLIIADDVGTDYFGFSEDRVDTVGVPNITSLLTKGIRFKNATANPVCSPTRAGIITGRYSFRTNVGNVIGGIGGSAELDTAEITIPRLLKTYNANIGRGHLGKWHLHNPSPAIKLTFPNVLGYQHFEGPFTGAITSYTNWVKYTDGISTNTITTYATTENVNNAVAWIRTQSNKRFFCWTAFNAPHTPLHLPPAALHTYTALTGLAADINANPKSYFKAMLQALDTEIGRLFDSLKAINRFDSTDFIFMGDNGNTQQTAQITDLSHAKASIYEYGVHEPFIISGPSVVNPGRVSDALINTVDIFATVAELFGYTNWQNQIPMNKPVDSKSLLPIIKNQTLTVRPWAFTEIFSLTPAAGDGKAMRNTEYKLLNFDSGAQEFYKLTNDPNEANNLLLGPLTATDISNYFYLCNEMATLLSNTAICNNGVGIKNNKLETEGILEYPNPFSSFIKIKSSLPDQVYELSNALGQIIYSGKSIETQNFSDLPKGIYFLKNVIRPKEIFKLMKE